MNIDIKAFVGFINEQPADRGITHDSWRSCAVGDFSSAVADDLWTNGHSYFELNALSKTVNDITKVSHVLELLNNGPLAEANVPTYGALQEWLVANPQDEFYS